MKLIYNIQDKPKAGQLIIFSLQQLLAIMTATLVVPVIVGNNMSTGAALFGAGIGTFFSQRKEALYSLDLPLPLSVPCRARLQAAFPCPSDTSA